MSTLTRLRRATLALAAALLAVSGTPTGTIAAPAPPQVALPGLYIVALTDQPGPQDLDRPERLRPAQDAVLSRVGAPAPLYRFSAALNGFVTELTRAQVKALRADPRVAVVERSTLHHLDSVDSPDFLGADEAWAAAGGPGEAGRGTVVGVVDSGIWPENPSFAALPQLGRGVPDRFAGACAAGQDWDAGDCNSKVVAARYFVEAFGEENLAGSEELSPRDSTGHGSHVAAIAAGNAGVRVSVDGQDFGEASGMAPGARIAVYKACWTAPDPADDGCQTADAVAAIDRAVADGVDVISYAMSGLESEAVRLAFLNATAAGVFVAASAGNDGPGAGSVGNTSPWITTVGASTHHAFQGAVVLEGDTHVGAMVSDEAVARTGLLLAETARAATSTAQDARLCRPGSLDAAVVQGSIVVCDRGSIPRVDKSAAVAMAGGVGMVLANVRPDSVDPDFHAVPTVHVDVAAAERIKRYVAEADEPRASIDPAATDGTPVPQVASFSARGPVEVDGGSLVKPDLTAPGVAVLSASTPAAGGRLWEQRSGTSMSTAHVAGLAALLTAEHPRWTPAMVKSALSTTADELHGVSGPLAEGAGQVDAAEVLDPGLVLDQPITGYRAWLAGRADASELNLPSIAVGDLTGRARVVRRVTNVSGRTETFTAQVRGLDGLGVAVRPATLQLGPGETGRFAVVLDRGSAQLETPVRGQLVWTGLSHQARLPVVVTPRALSAPAEAQGSGAEGTLAFAGVAGADGQVEVDVAGLASARPLGLTLEPGEFDPSSPSPDRDTARLAVSVTAPAAMLRVQLEGRDSDDLDLHLYRDGDLVAAATGSGADELLTVMDPARGDYDLYVSSAVAGNGSTTTAQVYTWVVNDKPAGNLTVPDAVPADAGEEFRVEVSWRDLDPTARWAGVVKYAGSEERTVLTVA